MILRNRERVAKRGGEREKELSFSSFFFVGMLQCHKYQSLLTGHNKDIPEWYHTLTTVNARYEKTGFKLKWSGDRVLSQDPLYDKLYIMQYGKKKTVKKRIVPKLLIMPEANKQQQRSAVDILWTRLAFILRHSSKLWGYAQNKLAIKAHV